MRWVEISEWLVRLGHGIRGTSPPRPEPPLMTELWQIHEHLTCLENQFDQVDPDLVEYVIFKLNAAERLMASLWQAARCENLVAWKDTLHPVIKRAPS